MSIVAESAPVFAILAAAICFVGFVEYVHRRRRDPWRIGMGVVIAGSAAYLIFQYATHPGQITCPARVVDHTIPEGGEP